MWCGRSFIFWDRILWRLRCQPFFFLYSRIRPRILFRFVSSHRTLFFIVNAVLRFNYRLLFSTTVRSIINKSPYSASSLLLRQRVLHPDIWYKFFFNFFKFFPAKLFSFLFIGRYNLIQPFLSTMFLMARLGSVFFLPRISFVSPKVKKRRRIKKKIRKKLFIRRTH